jgi:serine/threonine protein kinase/regulation of enolase protein 1 (concanavalin A-like superfamily)
MCQVSRSECDTSRGKNDIRSAFFKSGQLVQFGSSHEVFVHAERESTHVMPSRDDGVNHEHVKWRPRDDTAPDPDEPPETQEIEATIGFIPAAGPQAETGSYEFLGPPRGEGELGWLAHYRVRSLIGQGAIGLVFLAEDTQLSRLVALKVIRPELAGTWEVRDRFVREAQATAAIKHDHIVTIYQVGRDVQTQFLAMEYLKGMSLQRWLERGRKPSIDVVLRLAREIASGLAAAHRNGLFHRDIKPANIWLEAPNARVKILDFGMARSERDDVHITHSGTVMGTPAYMSPEQARGEIVGAVSDLFSLGCVLYRLVAGRSPFEGSTIMAVLSALASDRPPLLSQIDPEIRPELAELVERLLAKVPTARPASSQAVVEAVRAIERELLSERQKAEVSEEARRVAETSLPGLLRIETEVSDVEIRPGPTVLPHRRVWRIAALLSAVIAALLSAVIAAASFGTIALTRPGQPLYHVTIQRPPLASASDSLAKQGPPVPIVDQSSREKPVPKVAQSSVSGQESIATAGLSPNVVPEGGRTGDGRATARPEKGEGGPIPVRTPPRSITELAQPETIRDGWGKPVDPDGDCKVVIDSSGSEITITVPRTPHVLSAELGRMNAPRLLRPVRGDFDATVKVQGVFHPSGHPTMKEYAAYHGSGFLLWQDDRNYVRLEIATDLDHNKPRNYANFELRWRGELAVSKGLPIKDGSTQIRLKRRGREILADFSPDGVGWTSFPPMVVDLDDGLGLGVVAVNSASKMLRADLKMFSVTNKTRPGERREETDNPGKQEFQSSP